MNKNNTLLIMVLCTFAANVWAQDIPPFVLNGSASQTSAVCYTLTPELSGQAGSIWSEQQINLTESFEAEARLYLGCANPVACFEDSDDGADGIVFAFQPLSASVGTSGGGIGIEGVAPSLCIEIDTYPNGGNSDPLYDHIAMYANGDLNHLSPNSLVAPVPAIDAATNVEDCAEHTLNVRWDATTQTMTVYFDCELKLTYTGDVVTDIFNNDPNVFWGFTSATGACTSEQRVCINIAPTFQTNDTTICAGESVLLAAPDNATSYLWTPAAGLNDPTIADPIATPDITTTYTVAVANECNFITNFEVTITVNPVPNFEQDATICEGEMFIVGSSIYLTSGTYTNTFTLPTGCDSIVVTHLTVLSNATSTINDTICIGNSVILPNLIEVNTAGTYTAIIPSVAGCDSVITILLVVNNPNCDDNDCNTADALNTATCTCTHTIIAPPNCDDNDCNTADAYDGATCTCTHTAIAPPNCDDNDCNTADAYDAATCTCTHTAIAPLNCDDANSATIDNYVVADCSCEHIPIESNIVIMPTAFSPNGDGINDELGPIGVPLLTMMFRVYNRWGQLVFETTDTATTWKGNYRDTDQEVGVYVYTLSYTTDDNPTESKLLQGNITLLR